MECVAPPIYLKRFLSRRLAKLMKIRKLFLKLRSCFWVFIISMGIFIILKEFLEKVGSTWFFNKLVYKKIEVEVISNRYLFSGMGGGITWSNWFMHQWIEKCRHEGSEVILQARPHHGPWPLSSNWYDPNSIHLLCNLELPSSMIPRHHM